MTTLIKNGRIITATDDYHADIFIDGETVKAIGKGLPMQPDKTIDATGKLVIPGSIDPHVHMELPFGGTVSSDDFRTGTIAAAHGGTTTIIDFAIQYKGKTFQQTIDDWHAKAGPKCAIDYSYHLAITEYEPRHKPEFAKIIDQGITSFKLFLAYPGVFMVKHKFETIADFKGHSLQYFTTHYDLVKRQAEARAKAKAKAAGVVTKDTEWHGDEFVKQSDALARN